MPIDDDAHESGNFRARARRLGRRLGVAAGRRPAACRQPPRLHADADGPRRSLASLRADGEPDDARPRRRQSGAVGRPRSRRAVWPFVRRRGHHWGRRAAGGAHRCDRLCRRVHSGRRRSGGRHRAAPTRGWRNHAAAIGQSVPRQRARSRRGRSEIDAEAERHLHGTARRDRRLPPHRPAGVRPCKPLRRAALPRRLSPSRPRLSGSKAADRPANRPPAVRPSPVRRPATTRGPAGRARSAAPA